MIKIQLHPEVVKFFKEHGSLVSTGDNAYMFYPNWLRFDPYSSVANTFDVLTFDMLPQDLKDAILSERETTKTLKM